MCVVLPRPPCWGNFQSPADPPRKSLSVPPYGGLATGFATSRRSHHDQKETAALLLDNLRAKGLRRPLQPSTRGFRAPWTLDRCSAPASTKRRLRSPFGNPSTSRARCWLREESEGKRKPPRAYGDGMSRKDREPPISLRLPNGGQAAVDARAKAAGKTRNAYLVEAVLGIPAPRSRPVPSVEKKMFGLVLAHAGSAAALVAALRPSLGEEHAVLLREYVQHLDDIRACAMLGLGKDP